MYYDHFGQGIVDSFSEYVSFSLAVTTTSAPMQQGVSWADAPRFTGIHHVPPPTRPNPAPSSVTYPTVPLAGVNDQNAIGVDNHVTTPYSFAFNTSIQRQLQGGLTLEVAYVGRLGRHLMQQYDWGDRWIWLIPPPAWITTPPRPNSPRKPMPATRLLRLYPTLKMNGLAPP